MTATTNEIIQIVAEATTAAIKTQVYSMMIGCVIGAIIIGIVIISYYKIEEKLDARRKRRDPKWRTKK